MHDPHSLAWTIHFPWFRRGLGMRHWSTFMEIWHCDPERDGSDDSCDWVGRKAKPSPRIEAELRSMADWEAKFPHYFTSAATGPGDATAMLWWFWTAITWRSNYRVLWIKRLLCPSLRRVLPNRHYMRAVSLCANESDNILSVFRINPKDLEQRVSTWRGSADEDPHISRPSLSPEDSYVKFRHLWRLLAREQRPWWKAPKWHVHHWEIRFPWLQQFKRWLFSRCYVCNKGFSYGYAPISNSWHGEGPKWFRGEADVRHHNCTHPGCDGAATP